jgi:hypothetical protein
MAESADDAADRDLTLETRQRRTQTEVRAERKGQVTVLDPTDIQPVRIFEDRWIAVRGADHRTQELTGTNMTAPNLHISRGPPARGLYRRVES